MVNKTNYAHQDNVNNTPQPMGGFYQPRSMWRYGVKILYCFIVYGFIFLEDSPSNRTRRALTIFFMRPLHCASLLATQTRLGGLFQELLKLEQKNITVHLLNVSKFDTIIRGFLTPRNVIWFDSVAFQIIRLVSNEGNKKQIWCHHICDNL